jgi:hypothetical protein
MTVAKEVVTLDESNVGWTEPSAVGLDSADKSLVPSSAAALGGELTMLPLLLAVTGAPNNS